MMFGAVWTQRGAFNGPGQSTSPVAVRGNYPIVTTAINIGRRTLLKLDLHAFFQHQPVVPFGRRFLDESGSIAQFQPTDERVAGFLMGNVICPALTLPGNPIPVR